MRVFIGLGDICGYYSQLERGFREIGVSCIFVNAYPDRSYGRTSSPGLSGGITEWIAARRVNAARGSLKRACWSTLQGLSLLLLLLSVLPRFDVFIFSGGTTFLFGRDLWLLKLFKKRIIVVFHGSDSRPPYLNAASIGAAGDLDVDRCVRETRTIKRRIRKIERYADLIVNHSMSSHFLEQPIINWLQIGIPYDPISTLQTGPSINDTSAVIVHAPTRPEAKGTTQIEKAIVSLRTKGHAIRFVKLVEQPHSEVLKALSTCDFVVDELFSDTTMASFATEAAAFGKPAIVGMYGIEKLRRYTQPEMIPPALVCQPDDVEAAIETLLVDAEYRVSLGAQAQRFIEHQWDAALVAKRFVRLASNDIPENWWFNPRALDYLHGWGLTDQRARHVLRAVLARHGVSALEVADKPSLERAFSDFATSASEPSGVA